MLPESSESKIWSRVPWDSELRTTVLAMTSSNLAGRRVSPSNI
jgi:hypothetical protein